MLCKISTLWRIASPESRENRILCTIHSGHLTKVKKFSNINIAQFTVRLRTRSGPTCAARRTADNKKKKPTVADKKAGEIKGANYLSFQCRRCASCCHLWVPVTDVDVRAIMLHTSLPPQKIVQFVDSSRIQSSHGSIAWVKFGAQKAERKAMCLRENGDKCFFLKARRCSIYESRPGVCREHPFVITLDESGRRIQSIKLNKAAACAHTFSGKVSRRDLKKVHRWNLEQDERYLAKVKRWNRHPCREKEFLDFLGLND
jgi:Fe-S-cluster containining protein